MTTSFSIDQRARIVLSLLAEPGDASLGFLVATYGAAGALDIIDEQQKPVEWADADWRAALARWLPRRQNADVDDQIARAARANAQLLTPLGNHWPQAVDDLGAHAPLLMWVRGDVTHLSSAESVAIVGARAASGYGEHAAAELAGSVARTGAVVISGGAYGIDGAAHRAALGVGGATIAVMAGGVDRLYPAGHASLILRIAESGAVVSELPLGVTPSRWRFLARNRIIAALADATVVVEAGWRSGSLNTAGHASALGRPLGAVPGPITSTSSAGCHRLMREYDAVCITSADDVRELAGWNDIDDDARLSDGDYAGSNRNRLIDALSVRVARDLDELVRRSGIARADAQVALGEMLLDGTASMRAEGYVLAATAVPTHREIGQG